MTYPTTSTNLIKCKVSPQAVAKMKILVTGFCYSYYLNFFALEQSDFFKT